MEANRVAAERGDRRLSITLMSANSIDDCDTDRIEWVLSKPISGVEVKYPSSLPISVKAEIAAKLARTSAIYVKEFHEDQRSMMRFLGIPILLILAVISFLVADLSVTIPLSHVISGAFVVVAFILHVRWESKGSLKEQAFWLTFALFVILVACGLSQSQPEKSLTLVHQWLVMINNLIIPELKKKL